MKRIILSALVGLLVAPSLTTEADAMDGNAATTYSYKSLGTCGEYVNSRRSGSKGFQKDWMREYMTAVNRLIPGKVDFFDGIKEEGILL